MKKLLVLFLLINLVPEILASLSDEYVQELRRIGSLIEVAEKQAKTLNIEDKYTRKAQLTKLYNEIKCKEQISNALEHSKERTVKRKAERDQKAFDNGEFISRSLATANLM